MKYLINAQLIITIILFSSLAFATDVRGRIDTQNTYNGYYQPLPRAEVALVNPMNNKPVSVTYTGRDGFYYFYNIYPGNYVLVVNRSLRLPVNIMNVPGFDINPVLFR
jgi:hypothetical protein